MVSGRPRRVIADAVVWKRSDFRETSRIVTLLLREHGRVLTLAKGAHRPDSPFLGRLDFLNEVRATISPEREGLRLLLRAELRRERRGLRQATRYLAASHLAELCDFAMPAGRAEPEVFDLLVGGLNLIELCPLAALAVVVLGLEVRFLLHLGALPGLDHCADCQRGLGELAFVGEASGLCCREHAAAPRRTVGEATLLLLRSLRDQPGKTWPELAVGGVGGAVPLCGGWLAAALERRGRLRGALFAQLR
ncbi:MAG: DNA repair protein RecO [Planctomycetes bacterium]|nr:DNA repair protein RecO [Planctomycetota bacterium]